VRTLPVGRPSKTAPSRGALGNTRTTPSPQVRDHFVRVLRRGERFTRRAKLRGLTTIPRLERCGWVPRGEQVEVKHQDSVAHFAGVGVCGLVWVCPVCGPKIRQGRAEEIGATLRAAIDQGYGVEFATFTMRHHVGQRLADLLRASQGAWESTLDSRQLRRLLRALGYVGLCNAHDLTHGENGWHPHRHVAMLFERPLTDQERCELEELLWKVWDGRLRARGLSSVRSVGTVLKRCTAAEGLGWYLAKVETAKGGATSLGMEMARGDLKSGRQGGRTPQQILADAQDLGEVRDVLLWREYEQATFGRKLVTWSPGLRKKINAQVVDVDDQELAEAEVGGELLAILDRSAWYVVRAASPGGLAVLEAAEKGPVVLRRYLEVTVPAGGWEVMT
jgi:hypothetical protein